MIAVHGQECSSTRGSLIQTRDPPLRQSRLPRSRSAGYRNDNPPRCVKFGSRPHEFVEGHVSGHFEYTMDEITEFELRHRVVPRNRPPSRAGANVARGYFLTLSNSTRSVGVEDRKTMTAIRNSPQTAVERC